MSDALMGSSGFVVTPKMLGLDGLKMCPGCMEVLVRDGYCVHCLHINDLFEARRLERVRLQLPDREDIGVAPYEPPVSSKPISRVMAAGITVGLCGTGLLICVGGWHVGKAVIVWLLAVSK